MAVQQPLQSSATWHSHTAAKLNRWSSSSSSLYHQSKARMLLYAGGWVLLIVLGVQLTRLQNWHQAPPVSAGTVGDYRQEPAVVEPTRLQYPVWWHAPFYTGTGYSTEAISYLSSLLQTNRFQWEDVWLSHSGDHIEPHVESSLDPSTRELLQPKAKHATGPINAIYRPGNLLLAHFLLQDQEYNRLIRGRLSQQELERPAIAVCHSFPDCWWMPHDTNTMTVPGCPCPSPEHKELVAYRVGRTMFETASLPAHLVHHCNAMNEVWVPTEFNRMTFIAAGVDPDKLRVVPQGIDAIVFDPSKHQPLALRELPGAQLVTGQEAVGFDANNDKPYAFMSVFKWETRKGWDILLDAYFQEFKGQEGVELHIITKPFGKGGQNIGEQVLAWLQRRFSLGPSAVATLPRLYLHTGYIDDATYRRLYVSSDCIVLPTRGEGWGRPQMEAMAMGKPVITTFWSGPTAYINEEVGYPLAVENLTAADADMDDTNMDTKSENVYFKGQQWAQPNVTHLRQLMRQVVTHPEEAAAKGRAARQHVLKHFTPERLADIVMQEILRIQELLGPDRKVPSARQRSQANADTALCHAYPQLCKQGPAGLAEAANRAQKNFARFKATDGPAALSTLPGHLTVQELLQQAKRGGAGATSWRSLRR